MHFKFFFNLSIKKKMYLLLCLTIFIILIMLFLSYISVYFLSGLRAYVGGESFWSKRQKDAVHCFIEYYNSHNEKDYQKFLKNIQIPLGDKIARVELEKQKPDFDKVVKGLLQGQNHPDDVISLINIFRWFRNLEYVDEAVKVWFRADEEIIKLLKNTEIIHNEIKTKNLSKDKMEKAFKNIHLIHDKLLIIEDEFANAIGRASRWVKKLLVIVLLCSSIIMCIFIFLLMSIIIKQILKSLDKISKSAEKVATGDLKERAEIVTNDEIGDLAKLFNKMTDDLDKALIKEKDLIQEKLKTEIEKQKIEELKSLNEKLIETEKKLKNTNKELNVSNKELKDSRDAALNLMEDLEVSQRMLKKWNENLEERIEEKTSELEKISTQLIQTEKLSALGELTAGITHELNQPLNVMKIICQSILRDIKTDTFNKETAMDDLPEMIGQINKMAEIINHMRIYSRQADFKEKKLLNVNDIIKDALKFTEQQMISHKITVIKEFDENLPKIYGDNIYIEQVFMNLFSNAKGELESVSKNDKKIIIKTYLQDEKKVVIEVSDNGRGMSKEVQNKIFQPFFTTKEPGQGTGLGLSVSIKIIEEHGGWMDLESLEGEGTSFRIILPVKEEDGVK